MDIAQRYAQSEADEYTEQAERMVRSMARDGKFGIPADPDGRQKWIEGLAEQLRGKPAQVAQPQEREEKPFSSNEFWSDPEEVKRAGKAVRPPKL